MKFKAEINIMPHKELLDPQGKAVAAEQKVELACKKLLANPVMEYYEYEITEV